MNPSMIRFFTYIFLSLHFCSVFSLAISPSDQADALVARGVQADRRGDSQTAEILYQLALRAKPGHPAALAAIESNKTFKIEKILADGIASEQKGDLISANAHYAMILKISPNSVEAARRLHALKARMGDRFLEPSKGVIQYRLESIVIPRFTVENQNLSKVFEILHHSVQAHESKIYCEDYPEINFYMNKIPSQQDPDLLKIEDLRLINVPLNRLLQYICDQTNCRFIIADGGVEFVIKS